MTTYDYSLSGRGAYAHERHWMQMRYIDNVARPAVSGDDWRIMDIPARSLVIATSCLRIADGGAITVDVGDSSSATTFESNLSLNGTGLIAINDATLPVYYSAANYVTLHWDAASAAAKFWIIFEIVDVSPIALFTV